MNAAAERDRDGRKLPQRYGVIDQRMVSEGYLKRLPAEAVSLYVFLCVVADRTGRSWYSDGRLVQQVRLSSLAGARERLVEAGLIAWERPVYTVLDVPRRVSQEVSPVPGRSNKATDERPATPEEVTQIHEAFRRKMGWSC